MFGGVPADRGQPIKVAILPHSYIQRLPNDIEDEAKIFVKHPYSPKNRGDTEAVLRANRSWLLVDLR